MSISPEPSNSPALISPPLNTTAMVQVSYTGTSTTGSFANLERQYLGKAGR
jgi:hypothetical protein